MDEELLRMRAEVCSLEENVESKTAELHRCSLEQQGSWTEGLDAQKKHSEEMEAKLWGHQERQQVMQSQATDGMNIICIYIHYITLLYMYIYNISIIVHVMFIYYIIG